MKKCLLCFLVLLPLLWSGSACAESATTGLEQPKAASQQEASALAALNGKRIGVATGTTFDAIVLNALPDAIPVYINSSADLIAALESGKIDGFAVDEPAAAQFCTVNPRLAMVDEYLDTFSFGVVLPKTEKGEALLEELNAWLAPLKESGAVEQVIEKWAYGPEEGKTLPDYAAFPAPKGTLTLATEGGYVPMTYFRGTEIVGAEIDLIAQFCEANGYGLKVQEMNIQNRDYDFLGMAGEIDQYCSKNQIPYKMASRMHLAFEELVQQMLIPVLAKPDIQAVIEYSEAGESAVLTVRYNGPSFDVTAKGEALSLKVLQSAVSDMTYTWDESAERPNQVLLRIRTV